MSSMSNPKCRIFTTPGQVAPFVDRVIDLADANKKALGFLQKAIFREQANRGRLWIAVSENSGECIGYLLFGGRYPALKVFQLFVKRSYRKVGIGEQLIRSLITWAEKLSYLTASARVASDLPANGFWDRVGFSLIRQETGGKSADRMINVRIRELNTPSLLDWSSFDGFEAKAGIQNIKLAHRPIISEQTYVLDLNIFFDITKQRVHRTEAARLISTGLSQEARVFVTPEFSKELQRNSPQHGPDPILEFAKSLPVLPEVPAPEIDGLRTELEPLVFPRGISVGRQHVRSISDLNHLAYCVHHRATGFITREKAILAASEQLREAYLLEILSPADLIQPAVQHGVERGPLNARLGKEQVSVAPATESQRSEVERFLIFRGAAEKDLATIWHPGSVASPRRRVIARVGANLIAVASWDRPTGLSRPTVLHLYVDETFQLAQTVMDHVLEVVLRDTGPPAVRVVVLDAPIDQVETRTTATRRGFLKSFSGGVDTPPGQLSKLTVSGLISSKNWGAFRGKVKEATGLRLPLRIPTMEEFTHTGILIQNRLDTFTCNLSLFDFERLVSPGVVLCPGRAALIVPIQLRFAKNLFAYIQPQGELFPAPEALLHIEKAYFKSTKRTSQFIKGTLVLFYLSGSGGGSKEVIGCARVTYSEVLSPGEIEVTLARQGVLSRSELEDIANSKGKVHAFTFDNFSAFPTRVPFNFLRENAMISGANLITAERLSPDHCVQICEYGFRLRRRVDA